MSVWFFCDLFFFFKQKTAYEMRISDWSSDVCSSDLPRPVNFGDGRWPDWLVQDQRSFDGRTDVMTYQTPVLTQAVRVSGAPIADLFAKTTGTDGDFVVKVIDVLPPENATDPKIDRKSTRLNSSH